MAISSRRLGAATITFASPVSVLTATVPLISPSVLRGAKVISPCTYDVVRGTSGASIRKVRYAPM